MERKLVEDLWWFVENITDDDPTRQDKFFALRERVREYLYLHAGQGETDCGIT